MLNKVMLIGNLGDDPAVHSTRSGEPVANISLATNQRWRDDDGQTIADGSKGLWDNSKKVTSRSQPSPIVSAACGCSALSHGSVSFLQGFMPRRLSQSEGYAAFGSYSS